MTHPLTIQLPPALQVLTVPGLYGSGPEHWQTRWEALHPTWCRVVQKDWAQPSLHLWAKQISEMVDGGTQISPPSLVATAPSKVLLIAHSFGCLASLRYALEAPEWIAGMLLVAPADPEKFGVGPLLPQAALPFPTIVAASRNDPWVAQPVAFGWAARWGSERIDLGELGHVNADSALGDWSLGLCLVERLLQRIESASSQGGMGQSDALAWQSDVERINPIPYI